MVKCRVCGTGGGFGNSVCHCPMYDTEACLNCLEKTGQERGGFGGMGESFKCPGCNAAMKKTAWVARTIDKTALLFCARINSDA